MIIRLGETTEAENRCSALVVSDFFRVLQQADVRLDDAPLPAMR